MKKLLFVFVLGAFAACGNAETEAVTEDTTAVITDTTSSITVDTTGIVTTDTTTGL